MTPPAPTTVRERMARIAYFAFWSDPDNQASDEEGRYQACRHRYLPIAERILAALPGMIDEEMVERACIAAETASNDFATTTGMRAAISAALDGAQQQASPPDAKASILPAVISLVDEATGVWVEYRRAASPENIVEIHAETILAVVLLAEILVGASSESKEVRAFVEMASA